MQFPNLPYFSDGEVTHAETLPIMRTICRKYNASLLGRNEKEAAYADTYCNTLYEKIMNWFLGFVFPPDYANKRAEGVAAAGDVIALIKSMKGGNRFIAGDVTYVDFIAYWGLKVMKLYDCTIVMDPVIQDYMKNFYALKGIQPAAQANAAYPFLT